MYKILNLAITFTIGISVMFLTGCGNAANLQAGYGVQGYAYYQKEKSESETVTEIKKCKYEAELALAGKMKEGMFDKYRLIESCMEIKGYQNTFGKTFK